MRLDAIREPQHPSARRECEDGYEGVDHVPSVASWDVVVHTGAVPEILEVEMYRRSAENVVGRRVRSIVADDPIVCPDGDTFSILEGRTVSRVTRIGKVMTLWFDHQVRECGGQGASPDSALDLHFGMSGRLVVDGRSAIDALVYGASDNDRWSRFSIVFDSGYLTLSDPRRFGRVSWHREDVELGPDAFDIEVSRLIDVLGTRSAPVKAVLLDQGAIAGLGNMLVDEVLWRAGVAPSRQGRDLSRAEVRRIHRMIVAVLPELLDRGGSHAGHLAADLRVPGSACPRDGAVLVRSVCGGRTTFHCPVHQK